MSIPSAFGAPKSKIVSRFNTNLGKTMQSLPSALGAKTTMARPEVQQAAPVNGGGNIAGAAPNINDQQDSINRPSVGADSDYSDGTEGIAKIGQAATSEVKIKATNKINAQMEANNAQVGVDMASAQAGMGAFDDMQQGVSVAPTVGPNGSAQWINSNNNKYHDFDGYYGAQCVDLYNFYMTGFVGGRSSVGMGGVGYAQELWGNHDRGSLVQVAKNQTPQMGDIAIWSNGFNGVGGHVAIVAQSNGNGTIRVLNANVASNGGSKGTSVMSNLSTGSLLGYLRPKKLM